MQQVKRTLEGGEDGSRNALWIARSHDRGGFGRQEQHPGSAPNLLQTDCARTDYLKGRKRPAFRCCCHGAPTIEGDVALWRNIATLNLSIAGNLSHCFWNSIQYSYLQQHRAEMLQNFQDLNRHRHPKAALWLFLVKDLTVSLRSQFTKTLWGQTAIVVLVLAVLLVLTERHAVARERPTEVFCSTATFLAGSPDGSADGGTPPQAAVPGVSARCRHQCTVFAGVLALVLAVAEVGSGAPKHFVGSLCYGFLLAWIAGWLGNHWQTRP